VEWTNVRVSARAGQLAALSARHTTRMEADTTLVARGANHGRAPSKSRLSCRPWLARLVVVAVFGAATVAIVSLAVGLTPSALLHGESEPSGPSAGRGHLVAVPDLVAGHAGSCAYERPDGGGACSAVAPPLPTASGEPANAICGFQPIRPAGLTAHWAQVVTRLRSRSAPAARDALLSCASGWYAIKGKVLLAAILLNALDPRVAAPTPPSLQALEGQAGIFIVAASEDVVMQRDGKAWIAVQGGTRFQDLTLIRALRPIGSAFKTTR
jgi:hypothetical protein